MWKALFLLILCQLHSSCRFRNCEKNSGCFYLIWMYFLDPVFKLMWNKCRKQKKICIVIKNINFKVFFNNKWWLISKIIKNKLKISGDLYKISLKLKHFNIMIAISFYQNYDFLDKQMISNKKLLSKAANLTLWLNINYNAILEFTIKCLKSENIKLQTIYFAHMSKTILSIHLSQINWMIRASTLLRNHYPTGNHQC